MTEYDDRGYVDMYAYDDGDPDDAPAALVDLVRTELADAEIPPPPVDEWDSWIQSATDMPQDPIDDPSAVLELDDDEIAETDPDDDLDTSDVNDLDALDDDPDDTDDSLDGDQEPLTEDLSIGELTDRYDTATDLGLDDDPAPLDLSTDDHGLDDDGMLDL